MAYNTTLEFNLCILPVLLQTMASMHPTLLDDCTSQCLAYIEADILNMQICWLPLFQRYGILQLMQILLLEYLGRASSYGQL